jgi:PDZ domain
MSGIGNATATGQMIEWRLQIAVLVAGLILGAAIVCRAQTSTDQTGVSAPMGPGENKSGGVLEIAPQGTPVPARPQPPAATAAPAPQSGDDQGSSDGANNDVELYKTYTDTENAMGVHGPLPYLGISVHTMTIAEPDGTQQRALEVLSVDKGSPAAAAGIKGSRGATGLGASTLTASAMLGPAQELLAPLLKKTGQLGAQGDLIVAVDDDRVETDQDLAGELAKLKPGDTLWLTVLRESAKGKAKAYKVPIRVAPPQGSAAAQ